MDKEEELAILYKSIFWQIPIYIFSYLDWRFKCRKNVFFNEVYKSSILHLQLFRLTKNVMPKQPKYTIGVEYATKLIPLTCGEGNVKA